VRAILSCIVVAALACAGRPAEGEDMVPIAIRKDASVPERFAADELRKYLEKIVGEKPEIVRGVEPEGACIVLKLAAERDVRPDGFAITSGRGRLTISGGGPAGVVYGVYAFLERYLGCRWFVPDPDDEVVPRLEPEVLHQILTRRVNEIENPDFIYREREFREALPDSTDLIINQIDWWAKNRMNVFLINFHYPSNKELWKKWREELIPEIKKRGLKLGLGEHGSYPLFLNPKKYGGEHPDWYCEFDGKRNPSMTYEGRGCQFCTTNPDAVRTYIENCIAFLKENPEVDVIYPAPNDGGRWCECAECRKRSVADNYMAFDNALAEAVEKVRPDIRIVHLAYANHLEPPEQVRPRKNVDIDFAPWGRDFAYPFDSPHTREAYRTALLKWVRIARECGNRIYIHCKFMRLYGVGPCLLPLKVIPTDMKYFKKIGVAGFDYPMAMGGWWAKSLNAYAVAQFSWDAETDMDALVADFFDKYYGPAAQDARKVYELVDAALPDRWYFNPRNMNLSFVLLSKHLLPPSTYPAGLPEYNERAIERLRDCDGLIAKASAAAKGTVYAKRTAKLQASVSHLLAQREGIGRLIAALDAFGDARGAQTREAYVRALRAAKAEFERATESQRKITESWDRGAKRSGVFWSQRANALSLITQWCKYIDEQIEQGDSFTPLVWEIGVVGGGRGRLGETETFPAEVNYRVPKDWTRRRNWPDFPREHWPPHLNHAGRINIVFDAPPGRYVLRVGQFRTGRSETVPVLLDGRKVGAYTTNEKEDHVHVVSFDIKTPGEHMLTLDRYPDAGGGYAMSGISLERSEERR